MRFTKQLFIFKLLVLIIVLSGCGGGGGSGTGSGTGTLSIGITDSSTFKYQAIYVTVDEVLVNKNDGSVPGNSGWVTVARPQQTYNLLALVNGVTAVLGDSELEAGFYHQVRLIIGKKAQSANNILGVPHPFANYVILNDGSDTVEELKIPSGMQTGLKLVHNFRIAENEVVELILDFDACRSVVEAGNGKNVKYLLKPTIKVVGTENKATIFGDVTESATDLPVTGALVSAQLSDGSSARVVRATVTSDEIGYEGQYSMSVSPGQAYSVVVFSDQITGPADALEMFAPACANITVAGATDNRLDFALGKTGVGTISGSVTVSGVIDPDDPPVVYISFYSDPGCGYVELISLPVSPDPATNEIHFSVNLPLGTYDVVASGDGRVPDTASTLVLASPGDAVSVNLSL